MSEHQQDSSGAQRSDQRKEEQIPDIDLLSLAEERAASAPIADFEFAYSPSSKEREILASKEYYDYYYSRPANARLKKPIYNPKLKLSVSKAGQQKFAATGEIEEQSEYQFLCQNYCRREENEPGLKADIESETKEERWPKIPESFPIPPSEPEVKGPPRYPFSTAEQNFIPLYPSGKPAPPQYAPRPPAFVSEAPSLPPYLPPAPYSAGYAKPEYPAWPPTMPSRPEFPYSGYSGYPATSAPSTGYRYPYAQPEPFYEYPQRPPRPDRGYYMPPGEEGWRGPSYDPMSRYYSGPPPGLHRPSVPPSAMYPPMEYRPTAPEYRPRAGPTPYNAFLEDFKQKLTYAKKIDLLELKGHMLELAKDQFGSRHLQQRIQDSPPAEKQIIYDELKDSLNSLMTDAFGNYVVQMFIQYGKEDQRKELIERITKAAKKLAFDMYGCRCVQKAIETGTAEQKRAIVNEIKGNVSECVESQNANHVLQKCIECVNPKEISFLLDYAKTNVVRMATHTYGCRILQRIVEKAGMLDAEPIINEITKKSAELSQDQFGNYVVQHVLEHGKEHHKDAVIKQLKEQLLYLSRQKFSSNVVEKCFQYGGEKSRDQLLIVMLGKDGEMNPPLHDMMRDRYANYVVQKAVEVTKSPLKEALVKKIMTIPDSNTYSNLIRNNPNNSPACV